MKLTPEFEQAFDLLEHSEQNVFLTGKAGTGKSTFLNYFREQTGKKIAVVAPTGVAALNVQAQTIHSLFRFSPHFLERSQVKTDNRKLFRQLELLIIDEISMVRADVFDAIDQFLQNARRNRSPFGGVQVCLIGDLFQLPPVVTRDEKELFSRYYRTPFFFATEAYERGDFQPVQFAHIHRQNDEAFIGILNAIRSGDCGEEELSALNARVIPTAVPAPGTLVLTATNHLADDINATQLRKLHADTVEYEGELKGSFGLKGARLPAPDLLELKVGAQVMFTKNDPEGRWVNGTLGHVRTLEKKRISVEISGKTHTIEPEKWKSVGFEFDEGAGAIVEKQLGSYTQFPLMLAWAVTIHKSQGKTLERAIIDLGSGAFAAGQLYVALSRCRALSGIALKRPVSQGDILCDADVVDFMQGIG